MEIIAKVKDIAATSGDTPLDTQIDRLLKEFAESGLLLFETDT